MNTLLNRLNALPAQCSLWLGVMFIFVIAILQLILNAESVNRDGVLYIFQAKAIADGNEEVARSLHPSLIYPKWIAFLHSHFALTFAQAAHYLGLSFFMLSSYFFLKILNLMKADSRLIGCGVLIVLTSLALDKYLVMILRDHALWAGLMAAMFFYLRWMKEKSRLCFFISVLSIWFAGLFRVEALSIIPVMLGFAIWIASQDQMGFSKKNAVRILMALLLVSVIGYFCLDFIIASFPRMGELSHYALQGLVQLAQPLPITTHDIWLKELISDHPHLLKGSFFANLFVYKWIMAVGLVQLFLLVKGYQYLRGHASPYALHFLLGVAGITLLWPALNLMAVNVLTSRYLVPHFWILMILISAGLFHILFNPGSIQKKLQRLIKITILVLLLIRFVDVLIDSRKPSIDYQAANWVTQHQIPIEDIFVTNLRIRYYMNQLSLPLESLKEALADSRVKYFILDRSMPEADSKFLTLVKSLPNNESTKIYIYQR